MHGQTHEWCLLIMRELSSNQVLTDRCLGLSSRKHAVSCSSVKPWMKSGQALALQIRCNHSALCCADKHGAFVQPALYEAFGLTVVEAMSCGLPTFATNQGGPAEVTVSLALLSADSPIASCGR